MAKTNFAALTSEQKTAWARQVWKTARNASFVTQFAGESHNSMIHRITELTKSERGTRAVFTLVPDLESDGVVGDGDLEGNEEAIKAFDQVVQIDQMRNANRTTGRMADQATVVNFREQSKDVLGYWLGDRIDQLAFLTLSGITYDTKNNGAARTGTAFASLEYATDVSAPSANRHLRVSGTELVAGDTTAITSADTFGYRHLVKAQAFGRDNYIRGVKGKNGTEMYHFFLTPSGMAQLKLDADFLANVRNAGVRGSSNSLFAGGESFQIDGAWVHSFRHVFNTKGLAGSPDGGTTPGSKWGANGETDGQRILMCGAQALAMADIGPGYWNEDKFDYENQVGISIGKILGFKKPVFRSNVTGTDEDFGVVCIDSAL